MSTFEELVAKAKAQTHALRATLNELATVPIETPSHDVPEITTALAALHAIRNGYRLTEVFDPSMKDFMEGKVEGVEIAIEALEGRGAKRGRKKEKAPSPLIASVAQSPRVLDVTTDRKLAETAHTQSGELGKGKHIILAAIGQCAERGATIPHIALLSPYKRRSIENYVGMLKTDGLVTLEEKSFHITKRGEAELKRAGWTREHDLAVLSKGERLLLECIVRGGKRGVTKPMLMLDANYKRRSVDNYVTTLGTRELVEERDKRIHLSAHGKAACADIEVTSLELTEGENLLFEAITMRKGGMSKQELVEMLSGTYKNRSIENYLTMLTTREIITRADNGKYNERKD